MKVGPARVLALAYGFFVVAAGARSAVQIATTFGTAPLAYTLSAVAAVVYAGGLVVFVLAERDPRRSRWAVGWCSAELAGVVTVGLASVLFPSAFPDATVWSGFGSGYGYVPIVLPLLGLWWAVRQRSGERGGRPAAPEPRPDPAVTPPPDARGSVPVPVTRSGARRPPPRPATPPGPAGSRWTRDCGTR